MLQVAIFSCDSDINGTTAERKSKREGHGETHLPFFLVTYSVNRLANEQSESPHSSRGNADDAVAFQEC